jgi:CRP-like cAMP-binding protein
LAWCPAPLARGIDAQRGSRAGDLCPCIGDTGPDRAGQPAQYEMMANPSSPQQSDLIAALPRTVRTRLTTNLDLVQMRHGQVLYEPGARLEYVYFPTTCIVSLLYMTQEGGSSELAVVGKEGMVGVALFMGSDTTPGSAVVQSPGNAYRMRAQPLKKEFDRTRAMQSLMLRYTQALMTQMGQIAVCSRYHTIDQQLCRCLLTRLDRLPTNELFLTHDWIANLLGVRREGVTWALGALQRAGLIRRTRGRIKVVDRSGLEARVCECYAVVRREYARLLPYGTGRNRTEEPS